MFKRFLNGGSEPPAHYALGACANLSDTLVPPRALSDFSSPGLLPSPTLSAPSSPAVDGYFDRRVTPSGLPTVGRSPRTSSPASFASPRSATASPNPNAPLLRDGSPRLEPRDMDKGIKAVEALVGAIGQLNEHALAIAKAHKEIARSSKELASCLSSGTGKQVADEDVLINGLLSSSSLFAALHAAASGAAKQTEKEYRALSEATTKMLRLIAKEERAHDNFVEDLEGKIRKATSQFEKTRKPTRRASFDAVETAAVTDRYLGSVSAWGADIAAAKNAHSASLFVRRAELCRQVAQAVAACGDVSWRRSCEEVRQVGKWIAPTMMWANFCAVEALPPGIAAVSSDRRPPRSHSASIEASVMTRSSTDSANLSPPNARLPNSGHLVGLHPPSTPANPGHFNNRASETTSTSGPSSHSSSLPSYAPLAASPHSGFLARPAAVHADTREAVEHLDAARSSSAAEQLRPLANASKDTSLPASDRLESSTPIIASKTHSPSAEPVMDPWHDYGQVSSEQMELSRQESTASTHSFVAKMKEVYLQQKAQVDELGRQPPGHRDAWRRASASLPISRPGSGVAMLATKYGGFPAGPRSPRPRYLSTSADAPLPQHRHASAPVAAGVATLKAAEHDLRAALGAEHHSAAMRPVAV